MKRMVLFLISIVMILCVAAGCGGVKKAEGPKILKVGTEVTFPPFEFREQGSKEITGFDMDMIRAIGKKLDMQVEILDMDFEALIPDGYYGRSPEEPLVITDADTISNLLNAVHDNGNYRPVAEGKALEGLNGLWIDFGNGCVLGMYADRSYGSFCSSPGENGSPCYKLPPKLWRMTNELLEQAQ